MNIIEMKASAAKASSLLRALGNERRLMILCQLVEEEKSVGQLVEQLELGQAMVSQQLALLKREELVVSRRDGQNIFYALDHIVAREILEVLYRNYCAQDA